MKSIGASRAPRFHVAATLSAGAQLALPAKAAHHAARVLRLREGDEVTLFNGGGGECAARIARISRDGVLVELGEFLAIERESPLPVTLAQGISAGDRMDLTIQKAVELGVATIQPLLAEKSVVRLKGERSESRREHWQRVAIAACEQCGRNRVPQIAPPATVGDYRAPQAALRLLLAPYAQSKLHTVVVSADRPVVLAAGPEAGFSAGEQAAMVAAGFVPVSLGPRVLRTETAALAALAALNVLAGDA